MRKNTVQEFNSNLVKNCPIKELCVFVHFLLLVTMSLTIADTSEYR